MAQVPALQSPRFHLIQLSCLDQPGWPDSMSIAEVARCLDLSLSTPANGSISWVSRKPTQT
jgi:hypothetical protein